VLYLLAILREAVINPFNFTKMKKRNILLSLSAIAIIALSLAGCKPEPEGELGTAFDKVAGMDGSWKITKFSQLDLNNPVKEERDLSEFYLIDGEEPLQLTFNKSDRTYSVAAGAGKNYFGEGGTWGFDDDAAPSELHLFGALDTLTFSLGSMVREFDNSLVIELPRVCDDGAGNVVETVIYKFEFSRQ
jgi:hypothetical protein